MMEDLIVANVKFVDRLGDPLSIGDISNENMKPSAGFAGKAIDAAEKAKETLGSQSERLRARVMKAIIEKHLRAQGLDTSGASVEICKAQG
jgi:hypothetical protein